MEPSIRPDLLVRALNFHGQQLQKVWEAERGESDLPKLNIDTKSLNFEVFQQRQKHLSFQDRGKRLKLQQFIVKKASALYDTSMMECMTPPPNKVLANEDEYYAIMAPYENFLEVDKTSKTRLFFETVKTGDVVICAITSKSVSGMMLRLLCTDGANPRFLGDLNIKALCPVSNIIPAVDKNGVARNYMLNDTVCCEVLEVIADTDKLVVGMKGSTLEAASPFHARLGLMHSDDFPAIYKKATELKGESYEKLLEHSLGFSNPNNITYLSDQLGVGATHHTNMQGMRGRFSESEYAGELRQAQASKWAFRSVAEGIEHFKAGRHSEACQCLNKALGIDPRNVEGLVARGALYANAGSFQKAIADFENALKLNQSHQNARKYMGETLVALGRSFEDDNKYDEALKAYDNCLALIPFHEEAQNSIEFLKSKMSSKLPGDVEIPGLDAKDGLKLLSDDVIVTSEKKSRGSKKKRKSRKRRRRSSTSSSSSSSGASSSSSTSSSSSSDSSSASSRSGGARKKSKKRGKHERQVSLSPLSKRMALMEPGNRGGEDVTLAQRLSHYNPPALPFAFTRSAGGYPEPMDAKLPIGTDYELRVCQFLEQTKGDSEYEEKVRKFLEETARWKKERKAMEEKVSKKKKRKEKKSRDKEKGKKKKDHDKKSKKHRSKKGEKEFDEQMESKKFRDALRKELAAKEGKRKGVDDDEEFLYGHGADKKDFRLLGLDSLPDLDELQHKLSAYYAKVEQGTGLAKGRNEDRPDKKRHASPKVMYIHDGNSDKDMSHLREKKKSLDIFAESSSLERQESKGESSAMMGSKWKMQVGTVKSKKREKSKYEDEAWEDAVAEKRFAGGMREGSSGEKRFMSLREDAADPDSDEELQKKRKKLLEEKVMARKAALLEASEKRVMEKQKKEDVRPAGFKPAAGFRSIGARVLDKKDELPPLPPGAPPKIAFPLRAKVNPDLAKSGLRDEDNGVASAEKRKKKTGHESGSSRSRSRSSESRRSGSVRRSRSGSFQRSRSRSYGGRYRSSSRSRSRSFRSRSRSYSRSRSRSEDGHYRRRSRSHSDERRRRDYHANKYQGRYPRNRGTYYRPRFQGYKNPRGGGFVPRGRGGFHQNKFMHNNRGGRPFVHRGRGGRGRPFFHFKPRGGGYKEYPRDRDRRYDRPRSRGDSGDERDRRSYSRDGGHGDDPMKKVDAAKEKIDKYLADEDRKEPGSSKRDEPLSEGEERDDEDRGGRANSADAANSSGFVDRKLYEGKWADGEANDGALPPVPENTSIEEMDKFLTKVKAQKKEEMKERNKSFTKTNAW